MTLKGVLSKDKELKMTKADVAKANIHTQLTTGTKEEIGCQFYKDDCSVKALDAPRRLNLPPMNSTCQNQPYMIFGEKKY